MKFHSKSNKATQTRDTDRYASIRSLIEDDNIEAAIIQLQEFIDGRNVPVANDLVGLQARLSRVTNEETAGRLTLGEAHVEKNKITHHLLQLIDKIDVRPTRHFPLRELTAAERKQRANYLQDLKADVENRLRVSIHHARLIDLGIDDTPLATHLPWIYRDLNSKHDFKDYQEAFNTYDRRMLLLGAPGSGKTITLLHIAQQLITEAENDNTAPIPLLVNLSKFQPSVPQNRLFSFIAQRRSKGEATDKQIERWLINEFTSNPFISVETARIWIEEGRIAALLDGLDEVNDDYRAELVRILNATYLHNYPDVVVVVCSRVNEYRPLQDRKETRVVLKGAVTLQPLTNQQIHEYLELAQATGLKEALLTDETLYQMAQTPLTLSMMTLAYGGLGPSDVPEHLSFTDRKHHMMDAYVAKMLQRKERRDRNLQFDENRDDDVPIRQYVYNPQTINNLLGWLAVRLSVRMQTAVSLNSLYSFLSRNIKRDRQSGVWFATALCRVPLVFGTALLFGITLAPVTAEGWLQALYISLAGGVLSVPYAWLVRTTDDEIQSEAFDYIKVPVLIVLALATLFVSVGIASVALSSVLPCVIPPAATAILAICLNIPFFLLLNSEGIKSPLRWRIALITLLVFAAAVIAMHSLGSRYSWYIPAISVLTLHTIILFGFVLRDAEWLEIVVVLVGIPLLIALIIASVRLMDGFQWYVAVASFVTIAVVVISAVRRPLLFLIGLFLFFAIGGIVGGDRGAVVGGAIYLYLVIIGSQLVDEFDTKYSFLSRFGALVEHFIDRFDAVADQYLFTPALKPILCVGQCLPLQSERFFQYTEQALLLKRSGSDLEFMHRLLRDYFALRDLQPLLVSSDSNRRLEAIRSLGFQGDAAIDALAEFIRNTNPEVREAAAWALGRVVSPTVLPHIEAALKDAIPKVRRAAVLSTKNLIGKEQKRLWELVIADPDLNVQRALFEMILGVQWSDPELRTRIEANVERRRELRQIIFELVADSKTKRYLRLAALRILKKMDDQNCVPYLIETLSDRAFSHRSDAAFILGKFDDQRAVRALTRALSDRNKLVRKYAREALEEIQSRGTLKTKF